MGKTSKIELTQEQVQWLVKHFKHTKNDDIAAHLGCSQTTVHRYARSLGLKKTPQFMTKMQRNPSDRPHESHLRNGTYPPKGYIIPRSEEYRFKAGETGVQRLGKRKERLRIEKSAASRRITMKEEKARALFGLERKTKLRVIRRPKYVACQRYYLRSLGYIIPHGGFVAYYTPETKRSMEYESRTRQSCARYVGFEFKPISEMR